MILNKNAMKNKAAWENIGVKVPDFDLEKMIEKTKQEPIWVHFGAGNIFRGFVAVLQQQLLEEGLSEKGIIAAETYDFEIIDTIYKPYDNLGILVLLYPDGTFSNKIVASLSEGLVGDASRPEDWGRLKEVFANPSLQMASFTITEKGYNIKQLSGQLLPDVAKDMEAGPANVVHVMSKVASLTYHRYLNGRAPIALVSMDNCSENGKRLFQSVIAIAKAWAEKGLVEEGFIAYLEDDKKVSFPWSMIDKITPRPADEVKEYLAEKGIEKMDVVTTAKNTYIAPFINAEEPQYLVIEDSFPNGRPPLEKAGVIFAERAIVDKVEKMKVGTCLNPLHTALAIFGCLLGHKTIADEMKDEHLRKLVEKIGLVEGMPVVIDPGVIDPVEFAKEVIEVRLPNPYIPDTPQRIATDTSQKLKMRFGQTIALYGEREGLDPSSLTFIPLVIAGWLRYLMALDDNGDEMTLSPDPMYKTLKPYFDGITLGNPDSGEGKLKDIISNTQLFGLNLYEVGLGEKVEGFFKEMIAGKGAIRATLKKYLG